MSKIASILFCLSFFYIALADSKQTIGTTEFILKDLIGNNIKALSHYTFFSTSGEEIPVIVEDFYYKNGVLSMSGSAVGFENSMFIFKGTVNELYGWVFIRDKNVAYEYTTDDNKNLMVENVPVSKVFCVDDLDASETYAPSFITHKVPPVPHVGNYPGSDVNKLQSLPSATKVLYLDITRLMNGSDPITYKKEDIWQIWQTSSAAYGMFEVNVTTDKDVYAKAGVPNSGVARFFNTEGRSNSPVNGFGTTKFSTVYRKPNGLDGGKTGAHELGHLMGVLDYGGNPGGTYFEGFPDFKWVPIMGNYRTHAAAWGNDALFQWSKGEYTTANVKTDFFQVANKNIAFRKDDVPQTVPLKIAGGGKVSMDNNYGQIVPSTDSDGFTFEITADKGSVDLKIDRIEFLGGAMLDVDASIQDEPGKVVANHNAPAARWAQLKTELPKGKYTLVIKGGAEGTPQKGFSNYSSMGFYGIEGTVTGGATGITARELLKNHDLWLPRFAGNTVTLGIPAQCTFNNISVFSINGKRLFHSEKRIDRIDFSRFAAGVYTLFFTVDNVPVVHRIFKK